MARAAVVEQTRRADRLEALAAQLQQAHDIGAHVLPADLPIRRRHNATKAFVVSFSEALAHELSGSGVTVT